MPRESKTVPCESCGGRFKPTSIGLHRKSCLKNIRRTGKDLAFVQILRNGMFSTSFPNWYITDSPFVMRQPTA